MKIRTRFLIFLISGITFGMSVLILLSSRAQFTDAEKAAFASMVQEAKSESRVASDMLDRALLTTQGMVKTVHDWLEKGTLDREYVAYTMRGFLAADPDFLGTAAAMISGEFDDHNLDYKNKAFSRADGRFILYFAKVGDRIKYEPLDMSDVSTDSWLGYPLRTRKSTITPPYLYPVDGKDVWMTTASSPLFDVGGDPAGVFTIDVALDSIQAAVSKISPYDVGWAGVLSPGKIWVASPQPGRLGTVAKTAEAARILAVTQQGQVFQDTLIDPNTGKLSMVVGVPIHFVGAPEIWTFVMVVPKNAVMASAIRTRNTMIIIGFLILGASLLGVAWLTESISQPIRDMTEVMLRLAGGDNSVEIPAQERQDEVGDMSKAVLVFKENAIERARLELEQEAVKKELKYRAYHDPLTGLLNRFALTEIEQEWLMPHAPPFVLLYLDLDNFKNINDAFGHACGDMILSEVATRLNSATPEGSVIVRHGGDEFAILVRYDENASLEAIGTTIVEWISAHYLISGMKLHVGASVGITRFPQDGMALETLMIGADLAMREAKRKKNTYAFYSQNMQEDMRRKVNIEYELRHALERNEIYMVFQPQIRSGGGVHGVEALVRWESPELGFVPPDQFIEVAEESDLIGRLGDFIIQQSCAEFAAVLREAEQASDAICLSINISIKQFLERDFQDKLLVTIAEYGLSTGQVTIEITESLFIDDPDIVLPLLHDIRASGVKVSLDDFGTGYSSLSTLRTLPIDELKVDKAFIDNICHVAQEADMTRSIIEMGHTMGMYIVSEGVESQEQASLLTDINCDVFQGYHYAKPLRKDDLVTFLRDHSSV